MMSDFAVRYLALDEEERERFGAVASRLMRGDFVTPGSPLRPDHDWRFIERHADTIDQYLALGGWRLEFQPERQLARVIHPEGAGRVQFDRLTTACLILLRRVYHEQMGSMAFAAQDGQSVGITVSELREQLTHAGWKATQVSRRLLEAALRALHRAQVVAIERGFVADDRETVTVLPVIESVLPVRDLQAMQEYVRHFVDATGQITRSAGDEGGSPESDVEGGVGDGADADANGTGEWCGQRPVMRNGSDAGS